MNFEFLTSLNDISSAEWNAVAGIHCPFTRYEFLSALENNGCVGEKWGWLTQHLVVRDAKKVIAVVPLYIKDNSYGELVFDWSWAEAYQRAGLDYYPKLVSAIPYTPATGSRILFHPELDEVAENNLSKEIIQHVIQHAENTGMSSVHCLFTNTVQTDQLVQAGMLSRLGCQFQWRNQNYRDFDDYLSRFTSKKRKKIKRERRYVQDAKIEIQVLEGGEISELQWDIFQRFYRSTFAKRSGWPTLNKKFFMDVSQTMGDQVLLVMCLHQGREIAASLCFKNTETLYGRHWGCDEDFHSLHFEACYYQGLDYCIKHGLKAFEPGAQGEHKISRGFLPEQTRSTHWLADARFQHIISQYLVNEAESMQGYISEMKSRSPFKKA
jgi:uncharacterized protein